MSLLDKATIITTPTAHTNGVLHSIKGGAVADFDVVRGSAATRVNAEGLIEDISTLSGELVTNGGFDVDTDWTKGTGWSISGGKANFNGTSNSNLQQNNVTEQNKLYKVSFEVSDYVSGTVQVIIGDNLAGEDFTFSSNGVFVFYTTADSGTTQMVRFRPTTSAEFSIDNASVVEVIDATNIPRIDYTDGAASILLETQSTNLVNVSEDFSNASWSTNGGEVSITLNTSQANPSGSNGSYAIEGLGGLGRLSKNIIVTPSTDYTLSFYAKNINATTLKAVITNNAGVSTTDYISQVNSTSWSRVEINFTTGTGTTSTIYLTREIPVGESVYLWGVQLEELPYSTSYIPTSGVIATRLADAVTGAGDATTFNDSEGVLYGEMAALANDLTARRLTICDGSNNNRVFIGYSTSSNSIQFVIQSLGALVVNSTFSISDITQFSKIAIKYKENDCSFWIDGVKVGTDTTASMPTGLNTLLFDDGDTTRPLFGKVKSVITFDTALTDAELECLTTI